MKRILENLIICLSLLLLSGCTKVDDETTLVVISKEIAISSVDNYVYDLGRFGDEDGAFIKVQASHFEISEIIFDETGEVYTYNFKPKAGYTGVDYVEIFTQKGASYGPYPGPDQSLIKIAFNIFKKE